MPNFETYKRQGSRGRYNTAPTVTIQRRGMIAFGASAAEMIGNPSAIKYLISREEQIIGFEPCERTEQNAYAVRHYGRVSQTYLVSGLALCKFLGLDLSESRRYLLAMVDGVACIDLKKPEAVVTKAPAATT